MSSSRLKQQGFVNLYRKTLFRIVVIGLIAYLLYAPKNWNFVTLSLTEKPIVEILGCLFIFLGILGRTLATITIGGHKDRSLVKTELYSICRNPLYFASFLMAIGLGLISTRLDFLLLVSASFLAIFYPMMLNEARYLRERFEDFAEYEKSVPLFFPNVFRWKERRNFEIDFRLVRRTILDASIALTAVPVILLIRGFMP